MKKNKVLLSVLALVLVAAISVAGTVAYLTSKTEEVVNTFTVGEVKIDLKEKKVAEDGSVPSGTTADKYTETKQSYKVYPGGVYNKAPAVLVDASSEKCYVFVKVDNGMAALEGGDNTIADQMEVNHWVLKDSANGIWQYDGIANPGDVLPLFETFTVRTDWDGQGITDNSKITILAAAVQADNCTATVALAEAKALLLN